MSNETTTTSLTEIVAAEFIDPLIMAYTIDAFVAIGLSYEVSLRNQPTKVAAMTRWIKDAGGDVTTEGTTTLANTLLETEEATATVGVTGILRTVTDLSAEANMLGPVGLQQFIAQDGGTLMAEMMEDDLLAKFTSITNAVGLATTDLAIADMVSAICKRRTLNARGPCAFVLDDQQALDLSTALVGSSAQIFSGGANQSIMNGESTGLLGTFLGVPVYYSNLTDTSNTGASVNGALITTNAAPLYASLGHAVKWDPRLKTEPNVALVSQLYAITACYGVALRYDTTAVKVKTDA